jgi:hypothetical protein
MHNIIIELNLFSFIRIDRPVSQPQQLLGSCMDHGSLSELAHFSHLELLGLHKVKCINILDNFTFLPHELADIVIAQAEKHDLAVNQNPVEVVWLVMNGVDFKEVLENVA